MATNGLFDDKRRKDLRDAIMKDGLSELLKRKRPETDPIMTLVFEKKPGAREPEADRQGGDAGTDSRKKGGAASLIISLGPDQRLNETQRSLFEAIREGSIGKVQDAIARGADVDRALLHGPHFNMRDTMMLTPMTPLEYAKKHNRPEIVALLQRHGAKE